MEDYLHHIFEFKAQQQRTLKEFVPGTLRNKVIMEPVMLLGVCEGIDMDGPRLILRVDVETEDSAVKIPKGVWKVRPEMAHRTDYTTPQDTEKLKEQARLAELLAAEGANAKSLLPLLLDVGMTPSKLLKLKLDDESLEELGVAPESREELRRAVAAQQEEANAAERAVSVADLRNVNEKLFAAAIAGDDKTVQWALDCGANPNYDNCRDHTALHKAAQAGWHIVVKRLIDNGAFVNIQDSQERTALHLACIQGHTAVANVLLENGATANSIDIFMKMPIHYALAKQKKGCLDALLMHGAKQPVPVAGELD